DNIFWRRLPQAEAGRIEAAGARSLCPGEVTILGRDIIHSVTNPLGKLSAALHVYDGDLLVTLTAVTGMPRRWLRCHTIRSWFRRCSARIWSPRDDGVTGG